MVEVDVDKLFSYIYTNGESGDLLGKPTKYMKLGEAKLHAYHVTCEYIRGKDPDGNYIIDPQDEPALYLED